MQNHHHDPHPVQRKRAILEPVLWKALLITALSCIIWEENIYIEIGAVSFKKLASMPHLEQGRHELFHLFHSGIQRPAAIELDEDSLSHIACIIDRTYAKRFGLEQATVMETNASCAHFIKLFSPVAIAEMRHFGVPASILLGQALLASDAGYLPTAIASNNFFMRPCTHEECHLDHFNHNQDADVASNCDIFPNLWGSFRSQCQYFRKQSPYNNLPGADLHTWIAALNDAGYSNDPLYTRKLEALINALHLDKFDLR